MKTISFIFFALVLSGCTKVGELKFSESKNIERVPASEEDVIPDLIMGNRNYVDSVLRDVFDTTTTIEVQNAKEFGGNCDRYATFVVPVDNTGKTAVEYPQLDCPTNIAPVSESISNAGRYSIMTKICEKHIYGTKPDLYSKVMKKINGPSWVLKSTVATHKPNSNNIKTAYELFYQDQVPDQDVIDALIKVGNTKTQIDDQWKLILMTLCISPEWQAI